MTTTVSTTPTASRALIVIALAGGALLATAGALWAQYGTTVFFETIRAGWIACF